MKTRSEITEKVKRLLALAEDQKGMPEGEAAAQVALRLMKEHAIAMAQLSVEDREEIDEIKRDRFSLGAKTSWRRYLIHYLAEHCNCHSAYIKNSRDVYLFGHRTDIELVQYLYGVCESQINTEAKVYFQATKGNFPLFSPGDGGPRARRNAFCMSATLGLRDKLLQMRQSDEDREAMALVLNRKRQVDEFYENYSTGITKTASEYQFSQNGYDYGKQLNISKGGVTPPPSTRKKPKGYLE